MDDQLEWLSNKNERLCIWAWNYLKGCNCPLPEHPLRDNIERHQIIIDALEPSKLGNFSIEEMKRDSKTKLLSKKDLAWINKSNIRLCYWLYQRMEQPEIDSLPFPSNSHDAHKNIISSLDSWNAPTKQKLEQLEQFKTEWGKVLSWRKYYQFLKVTDKVQCEWAWDYLKKGTLAVTHLNPISTAEIHTAILVSFDNWNVGAEKELYIRNMKAAWSQKKYRTNLKDKKPYNIVLKISTRANLDRLAKRKGKKINEMLEKLINDEAEKKGLISSDTT